MLFNLCNESILFQKYINNTLHKHLNKFYTVYLNDILIYFNNELKHEIHVKLILRKLQEADLQMNIIKCKFHITQVSHHSSFVFRIDNHHQRDQDELF